jgi:HK97 family phage major capsid protein
MTTLNDLKAALKAKGEQARKRLTEISQSCEKENRDRTEDETKELETMMKEGRELKAQIERRQGDDDMSAELARLTDGIAPARTSVGRPDTGAASGIRPLRSMGQQFVESEAYEFFRRGGHRTSSAWRSPSVEVFDPWGMSGLQAATLTSEPSSPPSGGALIVPQYLPGIQPLRFQRLVVADLIAPGTTDSNMISYMQETTFDNAAAPTAEGAPKPESTLAFEAMTDPVRKIAHWLPVTDEMLEDVSALRSYIDTRMRLGVQLSEEDQLLQGDGNAPNLLGIRARSGITPAHGRSSDNNADAIFKQMTIIATTAFLLPDGIVINPTNWQTLQLMKSSLSGDYIGSGPFAAPQAPRLWGVPVAVTPAIVANTATVGAFQQASQFFRRGGLRVEASNSHADFFIKNLTAIRAEERGALAVYRPAAFGDVTGLE